MLSCPRCRRRDVRRSTFHLRDVPRVLLLQSPYRCQECGRRFYRFFWSGIRPGEVLRTIEKTAREMYHIQQDRAAALSAPVAPPASNRRAWVRHLCDRATTCRPGAGGGDRSWPARIRDVSVGGVKLIVDQPFELGMILTVWLDTPGTAVPRATPAEVVHVSQLPGGEWTLGCRFTQQLNEADLARFDAPEEAPPPSLPAASDRRVWIRHLCDLESTCQPNVAGENSRPARIRDVSCGGLNLICSQPCASGTILTIQVGQTRSGVPRTLLAEVMHVVELPEGSFSLGCRLTKQLAEHDLQALLKLVEPATGTRGSLGKE